MKGKLPVGAACYVRRSCDDDFRGLLGEQPLIYITGPFEIGKSSLMERAHEFLGEGWQFISAGLADLRSDRAELFVPNFFELFGHGLARDIDWRTLGERLGRRFSVILLDDLGDLLLPGLEALIPRLIDLVGTVGLRLRVIATLPEPLDQFFLARGLKHPKLSRGWKRVDVPPLEPGQADHLFGLLPREAHQVLEKHREVALRHAANPDGPGLSPRRLQCLCYRLFEAHRAKESLAFLRKIIEDRGSYE
jgi:hypothetical protein